MDITVLIMLFTSLLREGLVFASDIFMTSEEMGWTQAQQYCNERGGNLIVFYSQEKWENFKLSSIYTNDLKNGNFWLGHRFSPTICNSAGEDCFMPSQSEWWCSTFPETCEECIHVHQKDGKVHGKTCDDPNQVVCEKGTIASTSGTVSSVTTTPTSTVASPVTTSGSSAASETSTVVSSGSSPTTETSPVFSTGSTPANGTSRVVSSLSWRSTETSRVTSGTSLSTTAANPTTTAHQMTNEELLIAIQNLRSKLTVKKANTSLYQRKLTSVYESRTSCVALGSFAIVFLVFVMFLIAAADIIDIFRFLSKQKAK